MIYCLKIEVKEEKNMLIQNQTPEKGETIAVIKTNFGDISIKLFPDKAPKTVENFLTHAKNGYYNGVIFHRVIKDFMIQTGDPTGTGMGGESIWGRGFEDEIDFELHNFYGAVSMANTGRPFSNGSQFFIVQAKDISSDLLSQMKRLADMFSAEAVEKYEKDGGTPWLDGKHTVFGQVFDGMETVEKIAAQKTDMLDKPFEKVQIETIEIKTIE